MANKAFNSIDGFSVGQPANRVIDGNSNASFANANVIGNANLSGNLNVTGNANLTSNVFISNIANFSIPGGTAGQGIGTDGAGNLAWYTFGVTVAVETLLHRLILYNSTMPVHLVVLQHLTIIM